MNHIFMLAECLITEGSKLYERLNYLFIAIRVATPVLVLVLIAVDFVKAVAAGKEDEMKKAQKDAIIRIVIGVIIFFVPTVVNIILGIAGGFSSTCGIGW